MDNTRARLIATLRENGRLNAQVSEQKDEIEHLRERIRRLEAQDAKRESEVGAGQRTSREYRYRVLSLTKELESLQCKLDTMTDSQIADAQRVQEGWVTACNSCQSREREATRCHAEIEQTLRALEEHLKHSRSRGSETALGITAKSLLLQVNQVARQLWRCTKDCCAAVEAGRALAMDGSTPCSSHAVTRHPTLAKASAAATSTKFALKPDDEVVDTMTNICEDLETENFKLKQEVREATSRADALERELKSEQKRSGLINQYRRAISKLRARSQAMRETLELLEEQSNSLVSERDSAVANVQELEETVALLRRQLERRDEELSRLDLRRQELELERLKLEVPQPRKAAPTKYEGVQRPRAAPYEAKEGRDNGRTWVDLPPAEEYAPSHNRDAPLSDHGVGHGRGPSGGFGAPSRYSAAAGAAVAASDAPHQRGSYDYGDDAWHSDARDLLRGGPTSASVQQQKRASGEASGKEDQTLIAELQLLDSEIETLQSSLLKARQSLELR